LNEAFIACTEHLLSHGGHAAAAGLKIEHSKLDMFRADFVEYCSSEMTVDQKLPTIQIDAEVILSQLTLPMMEQLNRMAPFGQANPRPKFCAINVEMVGDAQTMGGGDRHLTVTLKQSGKTIRAVAFGKGEWVKEMSAVDGPIDIVFNPVINEFRGLKKVEIHLVDWRKSKQLAATA
jgi:single-stranded-DNA-specific exonuclease